MPPPSLIHDGESQQENSLNYVSTYIIILYNNIEAVNKKKNNGKEHKCNNTSKSVTSSVNHSSFTREMSTYFFFKPTVFSLPNRFYAWYTQEPDWQRQVVPVHAVLIR